jgi:hypothetical protein
MWKSIIYKEWLKTRWFFIAFAALGTLVVGYIFLTVQHNFKFNEPNNYWYTLLFMKLKYFGYLKFAPIAGALAISIAQFFPETVDKRIKLTFHLPLNENKVLLIMTLFGTLCLLAAYLLFLALFVGLSTIYFPSNIILPALVTIAPWFLAGFTAYYFVALIVLEPVWKYRFLYIVVTATILPLFFESAATGSYAPANPVLAVLVIISSIALLFSGYRFRKGEM